MAYKNIYDWHDSVLKRWRQERECQRRREELSRDQDRRFKEAMAGSWVEGKRRVNREAYRPNNIDMFQKWVQDHREELSAIWGVPKNPANGGAWERQSKIEPDLRNIWGTPGQTYTSCGQPKKRDPNDITDLCKVRVE